MFQRYACQNEVHGDDRRQKGSLTILRDLGPLRIGEAVLALADPLLHPWGDGLARVGIERWEATQAGGGKRSFNIKM